LNSILQTRDSARGLIVNMSDGSLTPAATPSSPAPARNSPKFPASSSRIPGLSLQIEGHTDSVGGRRFQSAALERRADSVRDFLAEQGVPASFHHRSRLRQDPARRYQ